MTGVVGRVKRKNRKVAPTSAPTAGPSRAAAMITGMCIVVALPAGVGAGMNPIQGTGPLPIRTAPGAAVHPALAPGAQRFEAAFAAGKIEPSWLITGYHSAASVTVAQWWLPLAAALAAAALAWWRLGGENAAPAAAAVAGTLTNTVGVLTLMVVFGYIPAGAAFVIGATHGLPEVILAVLIAVPVYRAVSLARARG